jgi:hypothetical protein
VSQDSQAHSMSQAQEIETGFQVKTVEEIVAE